MDTILLIPLLIGMFLAMTMGASGSAPSFAAAYGANLIRKEMIPGLFGIFVFIGALVAGKAVSITLGKDILPHELMNVTLISITLLSVSLSLFIANYLGVPQSTSQSTVLALTAAGVYYGHYPKGLFTVIIPLWFVLPMIAFVLMFIIGTFIHKKFPYEENIRFRELKIHPNLKRIVIIASCYVAFAIGTNNVGNVAGPLAGMVAEEFNISTEGKTFDLVLLMCMLITAPCFAIGSSLFGYKLVRKAGKDIIPIGPFDASVISVITATLLILVSLTKGIPTSLVQLNTVCIIALGITRVGWRKMLADKTVRTFWIVWAIAPVFAFLLSLLLIYIADSIGLL